jgi:hypothetical protein
MPRAGKDHKGVVEKHSEAQPRCGGRAEVPADAKRREQVQRIKSTENAQAKADRVLRFR